MQRAVARRGEQIRAKRARGWEFGAIDPQHQEEVLHDLFSNGLRAHVAVDDLAEWCVHGPKQLLERADVSGADPPRKMRQRFVVGGPDHSAIIVKSGVGAMTGRE